MEIDTMVKHECPKWALGDKNFSMAYEHLTFWSEATTPNALARHISFVSSILKAGDTDFYRTSNDYFNTLKAATSKSSDTWIGDMRYCKTPCRAAIRFYHRWLHERIAYVMFIENAIAKIEALT